MNWRTIPFVRLLSPLILGISLAIKLGFQLEEIFMNALLLTANILWIIGCSIRIPYRWRWIPGFFLFIWVGTLAYHITILQDDRQHSNYFHHQNYDYLSGKILSIKIKEKSIQAKIQIQSFRDSCQEWHSAKGFILAYLPLESIIEEQQNITFKAPIKSIPTAKNPMAFDYKAYLALRNIHYQTYLSNIKAESCFLLTESAPHFSLKNHLQKWRTHSVQVFEKYIDKAASFGIASSLVLGYRDALNTSVKQAYTNTGAIHVLAVSGLHVGLLCLILQFFLQQIPFANLVWKWAKLLLLISIIWAYVFFTGASASVLRAGLIFSLILLGKALNESDNIYNTLAASAFILLMIEPYLLFDVGFQLSYVAVLGIIYFHPKIYSHFFIQNKLGDYIWNLSCISLAAQITTLPISLYYFHQFPVYFWLSGLVVVPAAGLILGLGILLLASSSIPFLASWLGLGLSELIRVINNCIFYLAQLPFSTMEGIYWPWWMVVIYFLSLSSIIFLLEKDNQRWILVLLLLFTCACANWSFHQLKHQSQKQIAVYATNKASLIECMDGNRAFTFSSSRLSPKSHEYATKNFHIEKSITNIHYIKLDSVLQEAPIWYNGDILQFYDQKLLILHPKTDWDRIPHLDYDAAIVINSSFLHFDILVDRLNIPLLIFDLSNSKRSANYYIRSCQKNNIPYHDIRQDGTWIYPLNK